MNIKSGVQDVLRMATGAVAMLVMILLVLHFQKDRDPAAQLALKNQRSELVTAMQLALVSAAEAEKSAVLATTDEASQKFADQARDATAAVEGKCSKLAELLKSADDQTALDSLAQFITSFAEFQRVDKELLALAVQNTNLKAYSLAFGPAAATLKEMDSALARVMADDVKVMRLADTARIAAWRLLTLIPPHIAEESDQKMDALETQMAAEDRKTHQSLNDLAALPILSGNADLQTAATRYARFNEIRAQILKLSRENTNVRSLAISLNPKRKIMLVCQAALMALQQAIEAEPIAGLTYGIVRPR